MIYRSDLHPYLAFQPTGLLRIFGVLLLIFYPLLVVITATYNSIRVVVDYLVNDEWLEVADTWEDILDFIKGDICA